MTNVREFDRLMRGGPRLFGVAALPLLALVAANLVPLVGVVAFDWDLRGVMLLYWAENVVVGLWAIARMLVVGHVLALPIALFFCVHFGMFMFAHLIFVLSMTRTDVSDHSFFPTWASVMSHVSWWALAGLFVSHGVSFARNFLLGGEWRRTSASAEMGKPYPRMAVMHVAIIAGGWAIALLGQPAALLAALVVLKIVVDATAHVAEHRRARQSEERQSEE